MRAAQPAESGSLAGALEIDRLCDEFEAGLEAGRQPPLGSFLTRIAGVQRITLLRELLPLLADHYNRQCKRLDLDALLDQLGRDVELGIELAAEFKLWVEHAAGAANGPPESLLPKTAEFGAGASTIQPLLGAARSGAPASDRYQLTRLHGRGGMGEVWLAEDTCLGRQIAVKCLRRGRSRQVERFVLEAQITGRLEHPGIVPLHDLVASPGSDPFYVMKFVAGQSLKDAIQSFHANKRVPDWPASVEFRKLLEAFLAICRAIAYAHSQHVLHRDIKPDNVMLGSFGETLLIDWGLAKIAGAEEKSPNGSSRPGSSGSSSATRVGAVLGSPPYMSPEVAAGRTEEIDERTDVYLLGATLYELLTGRAPRSGSSTDELLNLAKSTPPTAPRAVDPRIPRPLEAICLKAMAHEQVERYRSALDLAEDIERFLADQPVSAYREGTLKRAWRWIRRHRRAIGRSTVVMLCLTLMLAAIGSYRRAETLVRIATARKQLADFRQLADQAQYFAADTNSVAAAAPYYDHGAALAAGEAALAIADRWGPRAERLPLVEERASVSEEMGVLSLVLVNVYLISGTPEGLKKADQYLNMAAALGASGEGYERLRQQVAAGLGTSIPPDERPTSVAVPNRLALARDHFLRGELERTGRRGQAGYSPLTAARADHERLSRAAEEFELALQNNPRHYWARFQLGRCYLALGRKTDAIQALSACIAMRPEALWAYSARGLAYGLAAMFPSAYADFEEALRIDPDFRPARLNRGFVYRLDNRQAEAMAEFAAVLSDPPASRLPEAHYYRALTWLEQGEVARADDECAALVRLRPAFRPGYWMQTRLQLRQGNDQAASQSLNRWLEMGWDTPFIASLPAACRARGCALRELASELDSQARKRVLQLALRELEQATAGGVPTTDLPLTLLQAEVTGLPQARLTDLTAELVKHPTNRAALHERGWLHATTLQNYELATADFREMLAQNPHDAEAHAGMAFAFARRGHRAEARAAAFKAVLYSRTNYVALHNVACAYAELSRDAAFRQADEDFAVMLLQQAVQLFRQHPDYVDELEQIRLELPIFPDSLRSRSEIEQLFIGAAN